MKKGLVIRLLSRLIPLVLFWDLLSVLLERGFEVPSLLLAGLADIYTAVFVVLFYASVFSAIATVVTGSPTLYVVTLTLMVVSRYHVYPVVPLMSVAGLYAILALDTAGFTYREGQSRSVRYESSVALAKAITLCLVLLLVYALPSIFAGYFVLQLVSTLHSSPSLVAKVLAENAVFKLLLVAGVSSLVYTLLSNSTEIISVLACPSKKVAFRSLSNIVDVNVIYKVPLEFAKVLVVVSFIAPLLYVVLFDYVLPLIINLLDATLPLNLKGVLELWWLKLTCAIAVLALSWWFVGQLISFYKELKLKGSLIISLSLVLTLYSMAVYYNFSATGDLVHAITNPEFSFLEAGVRRVYYDYYINFIYLLEAVSALMGFAP